jgi:hypothetical protein
MGLGVGAVISGDFFGWNYGLATGGFGGLFIATIIVSIMYIGLCYCLAEMSPALPHTGGAYSFARTAMGPWGGFLTGLGENMECVITPGVELGCGPRRRPSGPVSTRARSLDQHRCSARTISYERVIDNGHQSGVSEPLSGPSICSSCSRPWDEP